MKGPNPPEVTSTRPRRVRRLAKPRPFFPWGFALSAGLVALFLFGVGPFAFASVESDTAQAARKALDEAGAAWATPRVSGQWVVIEGEAPSKEAADLAVAAVLHEKTRTLFGEAAPATRVTRHVPDLPEAWVPPPAPAPQAAPIDPARRAPEETEPHAPPVAAPPAAAPVPTLEAATPAAPTCDQLTAEALARARIEFDTGSATLGVASTSMLDDLANIAASCPGGFRIEGHTDDRGAPDMNRALSLKRAEAVRAALIKRGIAPERVSADGLGADHPLADNATDEGRARNRRIDIHALPPT